MAISKKGKRKITVNNKIFLWWVYNEQDQTEFDGNQIKLISEDQTVYLKYGLDQIINEDRYIVVALDQNEYKVHIYCPKFEDENGIIKPSGIDRMIKWVNSYLDLKTKRDLQHAYSSQIGILKGEERMNAVKIILDVLNK